MTVTDRSTGATNTYSASGYSALVIDVSGDNGLVNISTSAQFAGGIQVFGDGDTILTFTGDAAASVAVDLAHRLSRKPASA